jgi:hypothetical protein
MVVASALKVQVYASVQLTTAAESLLPAIERDVKEHAAIMALTEQVKGLWE